MVGNSNHKYRHHLITLIMIALLMVAFAVSIILINRHHFALHDFNQHHSTEYVGKITTKSADDIILVKDSYVIYKGTENGKQKLYKKNMHDGSKCIKISDEKAPDSLYLIGSNAEASYVCEAEMEKNGKLHCDLSAVSLHGKNTIDSFSCVKQPYCVLNGDYIIECASDGTDKIHSWVSIIDTSSGHKETIARADMSRTKEGAYSGDYLSIAGGNCKSFLFQKVKVKDSMINNDTKSEIYEYDISNGKTTIVSRRFSVVSFLSGNKSRYVSTRYYYDIEKSDPNATILRVDNKKIEFMNTSVTEEVQDGKWISDKNGVFLSNKRVYFVNDKKVRSIDLNRLKTNVSLINNNELYLFTISKTHTISLYRIRGVI